MTIPEVTLICVLGAIYTGCTAQPVVLPRSVISQVGTDTRFNCTAIHNEPVYWTTKPYGSPSTNDIYIGETFLLDDYDRSGRFFVEIENTLRRYDLVIKDVKQSDGGVYICTDERGLGEKAFAELVVWDTVKCQEDQRQDSYMGENVFDLDQDTISFTCRMNYSGNIRPQFLWSVCGREFIGTQGTESGIASSTLILAATSKLNGANVTSEVFILGNSSEDVRTGIRWTSDKIPVEYAMLKKAAVMECPALEYTLDCNPECSYKLETINGTQWCAVNYSAGTDVKWYHFNHRSSETGSMKSTNMNALTIVFNALVSFCFLVIFLLLGCWLPKTRCWRKLEKNREEKVPLKENGKQSISEQHDEKNRQTQENIA